METQDQKRYRIVNWLRDNGCKVEYIQSYRLEVWIE